MEAWADAIDHWDDAESFKATCPTWDAGRISIGQMMAPGFLACRSCAASPSVRMMSMAEWFGLHCNGLCGHRFPDRRAGGELVAVPIVGTGIVLLGRLCAECARSLGLEDRE